MIEDLKQLLVRAESEKFTTYASCMTKDEKSSDVKVKTNEVSIAGYVIGVISTHFVYSSATNHSFGHLYRRQWRTHGFFKSDKFSP